MLPFPHGSCRLLDQFPRGTLSGAIAVRCHGNLGDGVVSDPQLELGPPIVAQTSKVFFHERGFR